jgi:hypothetical protein
VVGEVDLLLESEQGFIAIECKMTTNPSRSDFQAIQNLKSLFDKPLLAGIVVCNEDAVRRFDTNTPLYSVPGAWLLS